jgi:hypothetical protein
MLLGSGNLRMRPAGSDNPRAHRHEEKTRELLPAVRRRSRSGRAARRPGAGPSFSGVIRKRVSATKRRRKSECVGMVTTGGPASYVELLSCVEILWDARNIRNADALESDDPAISSRRRRRN